MHVEGLKIMFPSPVTNPDWLERLWIIESQLLFL